VLAGAVGHGQGGPGLGVAKEAPARAERVGHGRGRQGSGTAGEAPARRRPGGAGRARLRRVRGAAAARAVGGGGSARCSAWKRCEREAGERKGRAGYTHLCSSG
jgi:hypothetical protein